ncbi:hypothetical protein Cni_G19581 [Canna indica]|uniref:SWIM-type domain-containing protein n=1 Tax=Canna indica TaxID=4628 RepID=A0AAQ3KNE9_9LILI|nr:hypothetical protein Cni_G19581 [Canna indica]
MDVELGAHNFFFTSSLAGVKTFGDSRSQHLDNDDFIVPDTYANVQTSTQQTSNQVETITDTVIVAQEAQENTSQAFLDLNFPLTFDDDEYDYIEEELAEERIREEVEAIEEFPNSIFTSSDVIGRYFPLEKHMYENNGAGDHDFQVKEEEDDTLVNSMNVYPIDDDSQTSELYLPQKAYNELQIALISVRGDYDQCYKDLLPYLRELRIHDFESKVKLMSCSSIHHFRRVLWAFGASLRGFREYMCPILCIDATHLRGKYPGVLMIATSIDVENRFFPVAFAVTEIEKTKTSARSTTEHSFNECMQKILVIHEQSYQWISQLEKEKWASSFFPSRRYDIITTNYVECLNALFREVCGLPITTLIEMTRRKVSEWFFKRRKVSLILTTTLTGKMKIILAENRHKCRWHAVHPHWDHCYPVQTSYQTVIVDLANRSCSCRKFQLYGIPCSHVMAAISYCSLDPYEYCERYFTVEIYKKYMRIKFIQQEATNIGIENLMIPK